MQPARVLRVYIAVGFIYGLGCFSKTERPTLWRNVRYFCFYFISIIKWFIFHGKKWFDIVQLVHKAIFIVSRTSGSESATVYHDQIFVYEKKAAGCYKRWPIDTIVSKI